MKIEQITTTRIIADEGKVFRKKSDGIIYGDTVSLGYDYYDAEVGLSEAKRLTPDDFEEIDTPEYYHEKPVINHVKRLQRAKELIKQKELRKIILVISDGLPDDPSVALKTLSVIRDLGIEVAGIAIDSWQLANFINAQENITDITELAPAMFRILQQLLLKKEK